jgi:hypothetical protein
MLACQVWILPEQTPTTSSHRNPMTKSAIDKIVPASALAASPQWMALFLAEVDPVAVIILLAAVVTGAVLYFLPTIIASSRGHKNVGAIFALNLLLGCTFIGWVVALVWSFTNSD